MANAARRTYAECVKRATELKIQTEHTRAARKKLEAFGGAPGPDVPGPLRPAKLEQVLE